ncbi:hypothetical protein NEOC65_001935 [Neochlamydia sp. AcF65]|nr:hypothetical protein [Neochlamydia sp. AcF65]NGY94746.1 hypothetical protein [Neochlamydia sp. AcF84]
MAFENTAANGDERQMVEPLINQVQHHINRVKDLLKLFPIFEADKGYVDEYLRDRAINGVVA